MITAADLDGEVPNPSPLTQYMFTLNLFVDGPPSMSQANAMRYATLVLEKCLGNVSGISWQWANAEPKG